MNLRKLVLFIQLTRPLFLLGPVLLYALGAGTAHYLGTQIHWGLYLLGQAWVTLLQVSAQYLNEYFDAPLDANNQNRTFFSGGSDATGPDKLSRSTPLWAGVTTLTITASLTVLLIRDAPRSPVLILILLFSFLAAVFYSVPPVRLASSGYGELTTSILVASLVPSFAFLLQYGELHRLVAMSTFPLMALHLAMMLTFEFPDYSFDLKHLKATLLVRIGWQRCMLLHNLLILAAYLLLGLAIGVGLPFAIALPAFLPLPLGLLQVWQMRRIAVGQKPNWNSLTLNGVVLFVGTAYMLTYSFWTH